jgi:hypothetical protein
MEGKSDLFGLRQANLRGLVPADEGIADNGLALLVLADNGRRSLLPLQTGLVRAFVWARYHLGDASLKFFNALWRYGPADESGVWFFS